MIVASWIRWMMSGSVVSSRQRLEDPPFIPQFCQKPYIYGYLNRVQSKWRLRA